MVVYKIITVIGETKFVGKYRRDLEQPNWHCYEREDGRIMHFRKEHMVCVIEDAT